MVIACLARWRPAFVATPPLAATPPATARAPLSPVVASTAPTAPVPGERALVIGSTGYAAALLRAIGLIVEEGGVDSRGAFDLVLVEGAVEELPPALARRIAPGGRIGVAIRDGAVTRLALGTVAGGTMSFRSFADADVPLLQAFAKPRAFTF